MIHSLLIRYKFELTIEVFLRLSPVDPQKHFIAQVSLLIEPVDAFEARGLLALGGGPSLEMLRLAGFHLQFSVCVSAVFEFIQTERVTQHHLDRSHAFFFSRKYFDEPILSMQGCPSLLVFCELLGIDNYCRLTSQQFESGLLEILNVFPKDHTSTLPCSQKEC